MNTFSIVVPTYKGSYKLEVFINCFLAQTCNDWNLIIVSDGEEKETESIINKYPYNNISYYHTDIRHNNFGHSPRELGLKLSCSEWTILSGFDNYYVPTFIETFKKVQDESVDFIYCDFVLNHKRGGIPYTHINSKLQRGYIDIGNFAVRTTLLKEVGFSFRNYAADWTLVNHLLPEITKRQTKIIKIPQILYVHN